MAEVKDPNAGSSLYPTAQVLRLGYGKDTSQLDTSYTTEGRTIASPMPTASSYVPSRFIPLASSGRSIAPTQGRRRRAHARMVAEAQASAPYNAAIPRYNRPVTELPSTEAAKPAQVVKETNGRLRAETRTEVPSPEPATGSASGTGETVLRAVGVIAGLGALAALFYGWQLSREGGAP